jgi:NCS2 family nucleobase:cation symporter-2
MPEPTPKKPADIAYGVNDRPPALILLISSLQQIGLIVVSLVVPLVVFRGAGADTAAIGSAMSVSLLVMALAAVLQARRFGPMGSGYLVPSGSSGLYLGPAHDAVAAGGLHLMFGMTLFAGLAEAALSRGLRRLRPIFPPEVAGLVIFLMGTATGSVGLRALLAIDRPEGPAAAHWIVAGLTLATMIGLNVWTKGLLRLSCSLIGMAVGYLSALATGLMRPAEFAVLTHAPLLAVPRLDNLGLSFDVTFALPFLIGALAATMKAIALMSMVQRANDVDWVRTDMTTAAGGVLADGAATAVAGLVGVVGVNAAAGCVGLSTATGVTSRTVGYAIAVILVVLAFVPDTATLVTLMPQPVLGAVLLFSACFILLSGVEMVTSRMLDQRRTLVLGLSILCATSVEAYPAAVARAPGWAHPIVSSSLVLGTTMALLLNLVFRIGVRQRTSMTVDPEAPALDEVHDFMESQGATWGARRDVIRRAQQAASQLVEAVVRTCEPQGAVRLEASFDEFNLDLRARWRGLKLDLPMLPPSAEEIIESLDGERKLAGYLLRTLADRAQTENRDGACSVAFHFEH